MIDNDNLLDALRGSVLGIPTVAPQPQRTATSPSPDIATITPPSFLQESELQRKLREGGADYGGRETLRRGLRRRRGSG